jgi:hypothetical protein
VGTVDDLARDARIHLLPFQPVPIVEFHGGILTHRMSWKRIV